MSFIARDRFLWNYSLNFFSAILLIYVSKWLFRFYAISSLTLTLINCLSSSLIATVALRFQTKPSTNRNQSLFDRLLFLTSGSFSAFITLSNLSLQYNTLGTYQLIKLQVPPMLMLVEWFQLRCTCNPSVITNEKFHRDYSCSVLATFSLIFIGTLINTYADLSFHMFGVIYACLSVLCNALYQSLIQTQRSTSSYERLRCLQMQSFVSGILLLPCWPLFDLTFVVDPYGLVHWHVLGALIIYGLLAFLVNSSVIWCIKDDAAIGYNMVGQMKTLLIIFLGSTLFNEQLTRQQIVSILCTTAGCVIYVYITYRRKTARHVITINI
jgi:solute carrier family 35, member E3